MAKTISVPVLIVGGGIVGLSASLFLTQLGVQCLLVERHLQTSIHPRARGFNIRAMELFRELGLDDKIRQAGAKISLSKGIYQGRSLFEVIEPHKRAATSPAIGGNPTDGLARRISPSTGARATQDLVEPVLLDAARSQSLADVRFYTELVTFQQNEQGITATIRDRRDGEETTVHAQYMLGADGANSPVRRQLGIDMEGPGALGNLINILFTADLQQFVDRREFSLCVVDQPEVRGVFASINNSDRWVFQLSLDPKKGQKAEDYDTDRCERLVKLALGMPDVDVKILSMTPWQCAGRVASVLQQGRVFIAGDAAHQVSPWRGQGATTGVADVHNLAWKLAAVLHGNAGPGLLDTYNTERLPVGRTAVADSSAAADANGLIRVEWRAMLQALGMGARMLGYGHLYESPAIIQDKQTWLPGIPWEFMAWLLGLNGQPGTRVPHLWVESDGQTISTLDVCGKSFVLLADCDGSDAWRDLASLVRSRLNVELKVYSIGRRGGLVDRAGRWPYLAGTRAGGALLIRPDGFVAWRVHELCSAEELGQVLEQILCRK